MTPPKNRLCAKRLCLRVPSRTNLIRSLRGKRGHTETLDDRGHPSVAEFPKVLPEEGQDGRGCEPAMPVFNKDGYRLFEVAVASFGIMDADRTHEGSMFQ